MSDYFRPVRSSLALADHHHRPRAFTVLVDHWRRCSADGPQQPRILSANALYNSFATVESLVNTSVEWRAIGVTGP